jgi:hypothetical protein
LIRSTGKKYIHAWLPLPGILEKAYRSSGYIVNKSNRGPFTARFPLITKQFGPDFIGFNLEQPFSLDFQAAMLD